MNNEYALVVHEGGLWVLTFDQLLTWEQNIKLHNMVGGTIIYVSESQDDALILEEWITGDREALSKLLGSRIEYRLMQNIEYIYAQAVDYTLLINTRDAKNAIAMFNNGAGNAKGIATTMLEMLENAKALNTKFIGDDIACEWVEKALNAIIDEPSPPFTPGTHPYILREGVFGHVVNVYQWAFLEKKRIAPMSYPPLAVAAQCIANSAVQQSYQAGDDRDDGIVPHSMMRLIDDTATPDNTDLFYGQVDECNELAGESQ